MNESILVVEDPATPDVTDRVILSDAKNLGEIASRSLP